MLEPWRVHEIPVDPRTFMGEGVKMCRHYNWMLAPVRSASCLRYQYVSLPLQQVHAVARFRVCAWPIAVYRDTHLPREQRACHVRNDVCVKMNTMLFLSAVLTIGYVMSTEFRALVII